MGDAILDVVSVNVHTKLCQGSMSSLNFISKQSTPIMYTHQTPIKYINIIGFNVCCISVLLKYFFLLSLCNNE